MAISLYDVSVGGYLQVLGGVAGVLERGHSHFVDNNIDLAEIVETRLFPDMNPFQFQVQSVVHHSRGAIEGARVGQFAPPPAIPPQDYKSLQKMIEEARAYLEAVTREDVEALEGRDVVFVVGDRKIPFVAESFLMSFSVPNFHFHATTTYDILRMKGAPLGKRDYLGKMRFKP